jgi:C4-dicarboxylate-specific signal transduction histidine kinase
MSPDCSMRVLVIDDDPDTRSNLADILELDAMPVVTAGSAAEALARDDWSEFGAILLDRKLPDSSAEELLPRLRELAPQAAVLIVTGYADLQGAIAALRHGAADYILKPINPEALRASLLRVAERRKLELAMKLAQERTLQAERLAAIGQMMTGLAHESGNALARSQACLELLALEVQDRPEALDLVGRIQKAQNHLQQLYEEVRSYAAPLRLEREYRSVAVAWRQAWANLAVGRSGRRALLREGCAEVDLHCSIDAFRIEQVFRNIFENALAACKDPVEIHVHAAAVTLDGQPALRLAVRDNGPGLNAEQRRRIFEPFFTTKTKGTGLGMAIATRIIEAHGGQISVGASAVPGAEIIITLPREQP